MNFPNGSRADAAEQSKQTATVSKVCQHFQLEQLHESPGPSSRQSKFPGVSCSIRTESTRDSVIATGSERLARNGRSFVGAASGVRLLQYSCVFCFHRGQSCARCRHSHCSSTPMRGLSCSGLREVSQTSRKERAPASVAGLEKSFTMPPDNLFSRIFHETPSNLSRETPSNDSAE